MEKTIVEEDNEQAIEEIEQWVRNEQFGTLLTKSAGFIGVSAAVAMVAYSLVVYIPKWVEKLISLL